jgi:aminopeptidase N
MGANREARAWEQIATALAQIEYAEQTAPGHDAFAAFARATLHPAFERLGWISKADENPDVQSLRRLLLGDLGKWGDPSVLNEARRRFAAFAKDHDTIAADDQQTILSIVATFADSATFEQLHAVARAAKNETELQRYYAVLMDVHDPDLARKASQIALSAEIPPQADALRLRLVSRLATEHQTLAWSVLTQNIKRLMAPYPKYAPLLTAEDVPQIFWSGVPLAEVERWVKAQVPAEMGPNVERGMESARFKLAQKKALIAAADQYLH